MKAIAAICDIVPGWVWALIVAGLLAANVASGVMLLIAQAAEGQAKLETATLRTDHATALARETDKVLATERQLGFALATQEKKDADAQKTVSDLRADLRLRSRAAGGPGLRDYAARGCDAAAGAAAAGAGGGADDAGQAGRLLSPELEGLLLQRFSEADDINIAYASCREDSMNARQILNSQVSPPRPSAGPASPGAP